METNRAGGRRGTRCLPAPDATAPQATTQPSTKPSTAQSVRELDGRLRTLKSELEQTARQKMNVLTDQARPGAPERMFGRTAKDWRSKLKASTAQRDAAVAALRKNPGDVAALKSLRASTRDFVKDVRALNRETKTDRTGYGELNEMIGLVGDLRGSDSAVPARSEKAAGTLREEIEEQHYIAQAARVDLYTFVDALVRYDPKYSEYRAKTDRLDAVKAEVAARPADVAAINRLDEAGSHGIRALLEEMGELNRFLRPIRDRMVDDLLKGGATLP